ncbi:helix-turn-helix domain-containing protein [Specibacter cremeus]|uniref:helix-turn-helix domain-containing protein n=1 Tax=Specibacter cremeus TaxID=1629051 RepID=UPI000F7B882D|nr:helix-turn-helix domain-containing protein [Specibacter cremeus]
MPTPRTTARPVGAALRYSDPLRYARLLRSAHEDVISGTSRLEIAPGLQDSWRRAMTLGISPDQHSPRHVHEPADVHRLRHDHPLTAAVPALAELLGDESGRQLLIVTDASGEVLWRFGSRPALRLADSLEFVEGADWSESGIGTNAISEALRTGAPEQLFSAEHLVRTHHDWACTAAPIHHPVTGALLGVLDVSGPFDTLTPDSLRLVRCAVRVAEQIIGATTAPASAGVDHHPPVGIASIELLGERPAVVRADGTRVPLTARRAEILALLCSRQQGWSADELAYELYGEDGTAATVRIEMHRIRGVLGDVIDSNPYRLASAVAARVDVNRVIAALRDGDVAGALGLYRAPLLSRSSAVAVELLREELSAAVRTATLADGSLAVLTRWLGTDMGAGDTSAVAALERLAGPGDPRVASFAARARRLDNALR